LATGPQYPTTGIFWCAAVGFFFYATFLFGEI